MFRRVTYFNAFKTIFYVFCTYVREKEKLLGIKKQNTAGSENIYPVRHGLVGDIHHSIKPVGTLTSFQFPHRVSNPRLEPDPDPQGSHVWAFHVVPEAEASGLCGVQTLTDQPGVVSHDTWR